MKKIFKSFAAGLLCTGLILCSLFSNPASVKADDHSSSVAITDFNLYNSSGAITDSNPLVHAELAGITMKLNIQLSSSSFAENDTASFDYFSFPGTDTGMSNTFTTSAWSDITAEVGGNPGVIIGQWRVYINGAVRKVEMQFNSAVAGYSAVNDITLDTGLINYIGYNHINQSGKKTVKLGDITKDYQCTSSVAALLNSSYINKGANSTNNTVIKWESHVNNRGIAHMHSPVGGYSFLTNAYFEDNLGPNTLEKLTINGLTYVPSSDMSNVLALVSYCPDITSNFTRLTQTPAHTTYDIFKQALAVNQWGVYYDGTDNTLIINFGDLNGSPGGLYWNSLFPGFAASAADAAINRKAFTAADRADLTAYYSGIYGNSNAVSGQIIAFLVFPEVKYQPVTSTIAVSNTARLLYGSGQEASRTANTTLTGMLGSARAAKYEAVLYKTDTSAGGTAIQGAVIELQKLDSTQSWVPAGSKSTDSSGMVSFTGLTPGRYRFAETEAAPGYDINSIEFYTQEGVLLPDSEFDIADTDNEGHIMRASNTRLNTSISTEKSSQDADRSGYIDEDEDVMYTITVTNTGSSPNDIIVQDTLAAVLPYIDNPNTVQVIISSDANPPITSYTVQDLMSGISVTIDTGETLTITFTVHTIAALEESDADVFDNTAYIRDQDSNTYRPRTTDPVQRGSDEDPEGSVRAAKSSQDADRNGYIDEDEDVTYTITVTNTGSSPNSIFVQDTLAAILPYINNPNTVPVSVSSDISSPAASYTVRDLMSGIQITLDAGETFTFTFTVHTINTLSESDADVFDNTAYIRDQDNNIYRPRTTDPLRHDSTADTADPSPKTGDTDIMYIYAVIAAAALLGIYALTSEKRKNQTLR